MPGSHAKLSPSAAERWLQCPASVGMEQNVPKEPDSFYAAEGTAAHALAEIKARLAFGMIDGKEYSKAVARWNREFSEIVGAKYFEFEEMERHCDAYVELLKDRMSEHPNSVLLLEQRMDSGVPGCWGTSDAVIVSPVHVEIVDFKYGQGVEVQAKNNPQLRLYGLGALDTFGDVLGDAEFIRMTVHQPRLHHVLTEELKADDLRAWRTSILPVAEDARAGSSVFGPSESACRWCPASGRCRAQLEAVFSEDFEAKPDLLSPEEMSDVLGRIPMIREWVKAVDSAALARVYSEGDQIPGYKVVMSGGQRKISDPEGALEFLVGDGYTPDEVSSRKVLGIGALEKLMGEKGFKEKLGPYVTKGSGSPSLVPESDKRPSVSPHNEAKKDFAEKAIREDQK